MKHKKLADFTYLVLIFTTFIASYFKDSDSFFYTFTVLTLGYIVILQHGIIQRLDFNEAPLSVGNKSMNIEK